MATIGSLVVDLRAELGRFRSDMEKANRTLQSNTNRMNKSLGSVERQFGNLQKAAGALGLAFGARELAGFARGALQSARNIQETADKLGLATEALQEYRFAAGEVGVNQQTLDLALQRFTRRLGEARQGSGELVKTLKEYGIALNNSDGTTRTAEAVLLDLADAIAGAGDSSEQLRIAFKAFDSEGAALVSLMRQGADGVRRYADQANDLGLVLGDDVVQGAANAERELSTLMNVVRLNAQQGLLSGMAADARDLQAVMGDPAFAENIRSLGELLGTTLRGAVEELNDELESMRALLSGDLGAVFRNSVPGRLLGATGMLDENPSTMQAAPPPPSYMLGPGGGPFQTRPPPGAGNNPQGFIAQLPTPQPVRIDVPAPPAAGGGMTPARTKALEEEAKRMGKILREQAKAADAFRESLERMGRAVEQDVANPFQKFDARMRELNMLVDTGTISQETYTLAVARAQDELEDYSYRTRDLGRSFEEANRGLFDLAGTMDRFGSIAVDGFGRAITSADSFSDALRNIGLRLAEVGLDSLLSPLAQQIFSGIGTRIDGWLNPRATAFDGSQLQWSSIQSMRINSGAPGFRAAGGAVAPGMDYIVGEKGPELFVPGRSGTIIPNHNLDPGGGGRGAGNTVYIDARGADQAAIQRLEASMRAMDYDFERRAIAANRAEAVRSPGFRKAFGR